MSEAASNLLDLLERSCAQNPTAPAIVQADRTIAYAQLAGMSQQAGRALRKEAKSDVVALFFPMVPEFIVAYFGVQYAGKQALPLNLLLPPEDLAYILKDSGADTIVAPPMFVEKLKPLGVKVLDFADLFKQPSQDPLPRPGPNQISTLLYTSGTTGRPKGVELTHHNLTSNADSAVAAMELTPDNRILACLPSFHTFAITGTMLAPIACGGSLVTLPKFDPEAVLKTTAELKCNTLLMVPSMYRLVTRMQERKQLDMSHLKIAIAGGEALSDDVRKKFEEVFKIPLLEGYGQTESGPVVSFNLPKAHRPGTVGKPIKDVNVRIVNPDTLNDAPSGETGEIWVKGPNVMKGYHNKPDETAKALTPDGWLRTGDMGELRDGYIVITGRLREMVKVAGEMVFPAEVENAIQKHPAVQESGVAGVKDERKGEIVKAFVVLKPGETVTEDQLLQHCRENLAAYKVPRSIEFRPELPKGPTGKVMRRLLK